jgi:hypothetical protein
MCEEQQRQMSTLAYLARVRCAKQVACKDAPLGDTGRSFVLAASGDWREKKSMRIETGVSVDRRALPLTAPTVAIRRQLTGDTVCDGRDAVVAEPKSKPGKILHAFLRIA